jgi:hypothetical protein
MVDPFPPELSALVANAMTRLRRRLGTSAPTLATSLRTWTRALAGGHRPERYFTHFEAFPMLLLPWWLEEVISGVPDRRFQSDLVYSTVCGYYVVRMIDNLMDDERPPEAEMLPALTVLHAEFIRTYYRYFPAEDPFWDTFTTSSLASAELAARDAANGPGTRAEFIETSARKIIGARIPVAAVAFRHGRPELNEPWFAFIDRFGRWHQMFNDIEGWQVDLERGRRTYFLSRAPATDRAVVAEWVADDGLSWGFAELEGWMDESSAAAAVLRSPPLTAYLESRRQRFTAQREEILASVESLRQLSSALTALTATRAATTEPPRALQVSSPLGGEAPEDHEERSPGRPPRSVPGRPAAADPD